MEQYRSYTDPRDENDVTNKRYVDKNIDEQIKKVENDIDDRFKKSLGNIIVDSIKNKNIFNVDLALSVSQLGCNARIIEDGVRVISNADTTNNVYAIYRTIDLRGLEGKQLVLSYKTRSNKSVTSSLGGIELFYENAAGNDRTLIEWNATNGFSFQVKDNLGNNYYLAMTFFANRSGNQIYNNEYVDYYDIQMEEGDVPTNFVPYKKYGYNSQESMGSILVDDISCKNKFNIQNPDPYNSIVTTMSSNSIAFNNNGAYAQLKYHFTLKKNTNYVLKYTFETTNSVFIPSVSIQGNNHWSNTFARKAGTGTFVINFNSGDWDTVDMVFEINGDTNLTNVGTLSNVQLEEGSTPTEYTSYKSLGYTSGHNENGSWVKYDDGTLIQRGTAVYPSGVDSYKLTFPMPFKDTDYQVSTETAYQYYRVLDFVRSTRDINYTIFFASALKTASSPYTWIFELEHEQEFDWIAIGRWK